MPKRADPSPTWLILVLERELHLGFSRLEPEDGFMAMGRRFGSRTSPELGLWYARLLDERGRLVGIRLIPGDPTAEGLFSDLPPLDYVREADDEARLDVFLEAPPGTEVAANDDFGFRGGVFSDEEGALAVSLELASLARSPADHAALHRAPGKRILIHP